MPVRDEVMHDPGKGWLQAKRPLDVITKTKEFEQERDTDRDRPTETVHALRSKPSNEVPPPEPIQNAAVSPNPQQQERQAQQIPQEQQPQIKEEKLKKKEGGSGEGGGDGSGGKGEEEMSGRATAITALIASFAALIGAGATYLQQRGVGENIVDARNEAAMANQTANTAQQSVVGLSLTTAGTLDEGQKICRIFQGKTWRDGMIVPKNWTINLCEDYMRKTEGNDFQLGCAWEDTVNLSSPARTIPERNCGWK